MYLKQVGKMHAVPEPVRCFLPEVQTVPGRSQEASIQSGTIVAPYGRLARDPGRSAQLGSWRRNGKLPNRLLDIGE
jgi:hypothetical protein